MKASLLVFLVGLACLGEPQIAVAERISIQTNFLDFITGTLADGGANTYVAADGGVRLINNWDLNGDSFPDLVFPSSHDNNLGVDSFIYWGSKDGFSLSKRTMLPGDGTIGVVVADVNGDGFPDVILANEFNGTKTELHSFIYWGSKEGYSVQRRSELPTIGATAVAVADLNNDKLPDLVFASSGSSYQFSKEGSDYTFLRPASDIYWGSSNGFSTNRVSQLVTYNARDVKTVDLNGDGNLEILFAEEGQGRHRGGVRIYWGSKKSEYSKHRMQVLEGHGTAAVTTADLDRDGYPEILLANQAAPPTGKKSSGASDFPRPSYIYWGSSKGYRVQRRMELPTAGARDVKVADLNGDGLLDIIYANKSGGASYIYWAKPGNGGYSPFGRTMLPTVHASRCAIADLNRDGRLDLVFSNENDALKNEVNSVIYWNTPTGFAPFQKTELPTLGAMSVTANDLNHDDWPDIIFANARDGTAGQPVDTHLYWGNSNGTFSTSHRQTLKGNALMGYNAADLNTDGHTDLIFVGKELRILWGTPHGFSPTNSFTLPVHYAFNTRVADFNRDGYLDLSVSDWAGSVEDAVLIYWGGPSGFSPEHRAALPTSGARTHTLADFNKDGYLDIFVTSTDGWGIIYWNAPSGFVSRRQTRLPARMPVAAELADLNSDGYLDIIMCNLFAREKLVYHRRPIPVSSPAQTATFESGTYIYWGGRKGFSAKNRLELPTIGAEDATVADFNRDGFLDLVISSYHAGEHRKHPSYVYWGSTRGLSPERMTLLPTDSASGVLSADFNRDGWPDILFACHTDGTDHRCESFLYWGGSDGFSPQKKTSVPSVGTHFLSIVDIGNIANRSADFEYISAPVDAGDSERFKTLEWVGTAPADSAIKFQVRFGSSLGSLEKSPWVGPEGTRSFFTEPSVELPQASRWIQYKATLVSPNGTALPILKTVTLK
jgi:hypothetical protein